MLIAEADRPLSGPLSHLPGIEACRQLIEAVQDTLAGQTPWHDGAAMATRIMACTKARPTEAADTGLIVAEIAKALCSYPPAVASHATEHIIATFPFRPTPAEIHTAAKARAQDLRIAAAVAERVIKAREHRSEQRRLAQAEAEEDARAIAEGRETAAQRRARVAAEARGVIDKIRAAPDNHHQA